jgi:hypothetical protein
VSDETDPRQQWRDIPNCPGYQVNWEGEFRSLDREASGRRYKGKPLSTRVSNRGYGLVNLVNAEGKKVTRSVHSVMLETFVPGGIPEGMESRHLDDNPLHNSWRPGSEDESRKRGGNLFVGTKRDQHRDKVRNGGAKPPPGPSYDCVNHASCAGKVHKEGRRCMPCVDDVGRNAAARLRAGENLMDVARSYGYEATGWTLRLARKHGYTGSEAEALTQGLRRSPQRLARARSVIAASVRRRRRPAGDGLSPMARGNTAAVPLRGVSPQQTLGHSGHSRTPDVAERNKTNVTERNQVPYPADLIQRDRPSPARGGSARRSR